MTAEKLQAQFHHALINPYEPPPPKTTHKGGLELKKRFAIYRNNVFAGTIENIKSTFSTTAAMLGEKNFLALSQSFIRKHPPKSPVMLLYGERFVKFLIENNIHPLILQIADMEWKIQDAMHEENAEPLQIQHLQKVKSQQQQHIKLLPHPALRTIQANWKLFDYDKNLNYDDGFWENIPKPDICSFIIIRPYFEVKQILIENHDYQFLQILMNGDTIGQAYEKICELYPDFNLTNALFLLISKSCFCKLEVQE